MKNFIVVAVIAAFSGMAFANEPAAPAAAPAQTEPAMGKDKAAAAPTADAPVKAGKKDKKKKKK